MSLAERGRSLGRYDDGLQNKPKRVCGPRRNEEVLERSIEKPVGRRFKSGRPHQSIKVKVPYRVDVCLVKKVFMMKLSDIQPSQLYICFEKFFKAMKTFNADDPIPVKKFENDVVSVDGHTRAFAAFLCGFSEVPVNREKEVVNSNLANLL